jgi:transposase
VNGEADADENQLRISADAKSVVKIGEFSRGGKNRVKTEAADHDFRPEEVLTPYGLLAPAEGQLYLTFTASKATADFEADTIEAWWKSVRHRYPTMKILVINLDNGPEHHSRRTQFMKRMTEFADRFGITIRLAYYPPYHSKYNSIERCWGVLEMHWNGSLLDSRETALGFAQSMTWKGQHPTVTMKTSTYESGKRLTQREMAQLEKRFHRDPDLPRWFVDIPPLKRGFHQWDRDN